MVRILWQRLRHAWTAAVASASVSASWMDDHGYRMGKRGWEW